MSNWGTAARACGLIAGNGCIHPALAVCMPGNVGHMQHSVEGMLSRCSTDGPSEMQDVHIDEPYLMPAARAARTPMWLSSMTTHLHASHALQ
jgi:hypothetical protein